VRIIYRDTVESALAHIDRETKLVEISENFKFFESVVESLISKHANQYALIRKKEIVAFFDSIVLAQLEANALFSDGLFSVQKVANEPVNLGYYSHVDNSRSA